MQKLLQNNKTTQTRSTL